MAEEPEREDVDACLVMADGTVREVAVGWRPMDMSPEAVADRERIAARYRAGRAGPGLNPV